MTLAEAREHLRQLAAQASQTRRRLRLNLSGKLLAVLRRGPRTVYYTPEDRVIVEGDTTHIERRKS